MRYVMNQKILCLGNDFVVRDESGRDVLYVDGRALSIGDKLSVLDMAGRELAFIRQKLLSWGKTYEVYRGGELAAVVKKELFTFFRCALTVDVPGPDDLEASGDFFDHEYTFQRHGQPAASVSKRWFTFADSYGIETADGEDDVLIIASAIVIDLCCHDGKKH
jgi:uncharacterized protein YxjI